MILDFDSTAIGETYHLHNGVDTMKFSQVADLMADAYGEPIKYPDSEAAFREKLGPSFIAYYRGRPEAVEYYLEYCRWEYEGVTGHLADDLLAGEADLTPGHFGLEPRTFRQFLIDNRIAFLG